MPKLNLTSSLFLAAGAAIGALLFAPKSGEELRKDLKKEADRLSEQARQVADDFKEDLNDAYHQAKSEVAEDKLALEQKKEELGYTVREIERELGGDEVIPNDEEKLQAALKDANVADNSEFQPNL